MQKSQSFSQVDEGGSSVGSSVSRKQDDVNWQQDEENVGSIEHGIFGVLFTVAHRRAPGRVYMVASLFFEWLQIFLLLVNPAYGFDIDTTNRVWQAFSLIRLNHFMQTRGLTFFLGCMYALVASLALVLAICFWIYNCFKTNDFERTWPIVIVRWYSLTFFQMFSVASAILLLMTMDCQYFSVPDDQLGRHAIFQDTMCWTMPYMIHVAIAGITFAAFVVVAGVFTTSEVELNPLSNSPLAMAHTKVEGYGFLIKMAMVCFTVFLNNVRWMSVLQLVSTFLLLYLYLRWLPYLSEAVNCVRVAIYSSTFWAAIMLAVMAFRPGVSSSDPDVVYKQQQALTIVVWAGIVPVALVGAYAAYQRQRFFRITVANKFRDAPLDMKPTHIYEFEDPRFVEMTSRCCRVWVSRDVLDEEVVQVAERVLRAGMSMLHQPFMAICWSSFLIDVRTSYQSGYVALQQAKKMPNQTVLERFCIFIREQEHTQKASAASSGDNSSSADLMTYVEFQRSYRLVLRLHNEALSAKKYFWETLLHSSVRFDSVAKAVALVDQTVRQSEMMYKQVLARHGNSVKLLVLYVKFLKYVKNDPWGASRWGAEAEKLQKAEEEANERAVLGETDGAKRKIQGFDENKGIVIVCANCLIRMVNESATAMFGYQQPAELVGKNINCIVPPPFSKNHNNYVRAFIETGVSKVLNNISEVVVTHKDGYVIPVKMYVTKVSGVGEDSVFMGILQQLPTDPEEATVWLMANGQILSCDMIFTDWLGYRQEDLHMKALKDMLLNPTDFDEMLVHAKKAAAVPKYMGRRRSSFVSCDDTGAVPIEAPMSPLPIKAVYNESQTSRWSLNTLDLRHNCLDAPVSLSASMHLSGMVDVPLIVVKLKRAPGSSSGPQYLLVTDDKGRITHVTGQLAKRLGTTASKMQSNQAVNAMDMLLPEPFVKLHRWAQVNKAGEPTQPWGCRSGLSVPLVVQSTEGYTTAPFALKVKSQNAKNGPGKIYITQLEERTPEQVLDERRLSVLVNSKGTVVKVGSSSASLFGFNAEPLIGCPLAHILDIFQPPLDLAASTDVTAMLDHEEQVAKMLLLMAKKSYEHPGCCWRVGVSAIRDPVAQLALGDLGRELLAHRTVPAVMTVKPHLGEPRVEGAQEILQTEMHYQIELWKTELMCGVLEVDTAGNVVPSTFVKEQPAYSAHRLLGFPPALLDGTPLATLLGLTHSYQQLVEMLFREGGLNTRASSTALAPRVGAKGGLRNTTRQKREVGPMHTVKLRHPSDGNELHMQVQAATKQDGTAGTSLYLTLHVVQPRCGKEDLMCMLPTWQYPAAPGASFLRSASSLKPHKSVGLAPMKPLVQQPNPFMSPVPPISIRGTNKATAQFALDAEEGDNKGSASPRAPRALSRTNTRELATRPSEAPTTASHLTEEGRERIAAWIPPPSARIHRTALEGQVEGGVRVGGSDEYVCDEEEESLDEPLVALAPEPEPEETADLAANELEEAGADMNDFRRGKRLKKLVKLLESPQAVARVKRFKLLAIAAVILVVVTDLVMLMVFQQLVQKQVAQVNYLRQAARAGSRVMQIAQLCTSIQLLVSSHFPMDPNMRNLGSGTPEADIQANIDMMVKRIADLDDLHHGIYRGFDNVQSLPDKYGLRELWDDPVFAMRQYHKVGNTTISTVKYDSLWSMGNAYVLAAGSIADSVLRDYPLNDTELRYQLPNDTRMLFVLYNGPRYLVDAYSTTLDGLMQVAVEDASRVNNIQLVILGVEGVFLAMLSFFALCYIVSKVIDQRCKVFAVFLKVPQGVIKAEAARANSLLEGAEDDADDAEDAARAQAPGQPPEIPEGAGKRISILGVSKSVDQKTVIEATPTDKAPPGLFNRWKASLSQHFKAFTTQADTKKGRIRSSQFAVLAIAWPFLVWAILVIFINALGWKSLANIREPIAVSNIVQFVSIRTNRAVFWSQRLSSQMYLNPDYGFTAQPDTPGPVLDRIKEDYRNRLADQYHALLKEYDAMLYGSQALSVINETSPHFRLATQGILFQADASYIFHNSGCLAENATDCLPPDHPFEKYVFSGLDQALRHLFTSIEDLLILPNDETVLANEPFDYIYEVGNRQIIGALEGLIDVYSTHVKAVYNQALTLHIVALAMCCVLGVIFVFFILLPTVRRIAHERRRMAELLSHLPPDMDVEGMVSEAVEYTPTVGAGTSRSAKSGRLVHSLSQI